MRIENIELSNWKNFKHANASFSQRTFLIGPNASGKSNFLDAIRFLKDIASFQSGFQKAVSDRGGVSKIRCLNARKDPMVSISISVSDEGDVWDYEIGFSQDNRKRPVVKREIVKLNQEVIISRPDIDDRSDIERLSQTFLEQVNANRDFRPLATFLSSIKYLHIVPHIVRNTSYFNGTDDPFGSNILEQIHNTSRQSRESKLKKLGKLLSIAVPQLREIKIDRDAKTGEIHLLGRFEHWRPNAGWLDESQFSDGTLRLLGLFWSLNTATGPVLLEEPELSLHPQIVSRLPEMLLRAFQDKRSKRQQVIVSTHSLEVLRNKGIAPEEVIVMIPSEDGTIVNPMSKRRDIELLMKSGISIAEIAMDSYNSQAMEQLDLFLSE